jgi:hypothetical protein
MGFLSEYKWAVSVVLGLCIMILAIAISKRRSRTPHRFEPGQTDRSHLGERDDSIVEPDESLGALDDKESPSRSMSAHKGGTKPSSRRRDSSSMSANAVITQLGLDRLYTSREQPPSHTSTRTPSGYISLEILYGTSRARNALKGPSDVYGTDHGALRFGVTSVSIPARHRPGHLERPTLIRLELRENPEKHFVILSLEELNRSAWIEAVDGLAATLTSTDALGLEIRSFPVAARLAAT